MTTTKPIHRRTLLRGLGSGLVSLPFLARLPAAHAEEYPLRFVVIFTPNDNIEKAYWQPNGDQLPSVMAPLGPFQSHVKCIGPLWLATRSKVAVDAHWAAAQILTGMPIQFNGETPYAGGTSVDQAIAQHLEVEPMVVGVRCGGPSVRGRISYTGPNAPVHPDVDPLHVFDKWLGAYAQPPEALADWRGQRGHVLDALAGQLGMLKSSVGTADWVRLEAHLEGIGELEKALTSTATGSCEPTTPGADLDYTTNENAPAGVRHQMDIIATALACDLTRVAVLQIANGGGNEWTPTWSGEGLGGFESKSLHNLAHSWYGETHDVYSAHRVALETWYYELLAYFMELLAARPEGDGSLLDNTLILWVKELGYSHSQKGYHMMVAGGAGGQLSSGLYVDGGSKPINHVLAACCNLMGLDVDGFGDPDFSGVLAL